MSNGSEGKLCVNCKWLREKRGLFGVKRMCGHPVLVNLVTGEPKMKCGDARFYGHLCGERGDYYE